MESKSVLKRLCVQDPVCMAEMIADQGALIALINAELDERARLLLESTHAGCKLTDEVERLKALVSMQSEALRFYANGFHRKLISNLSTQDDVAEVKGVGWEEHGDLYNGDTQYVEIGFKANEALSATEETVSAYKREVQADVLENASKLFDAGDWFARDKLIAMASELRAKGE